MVSLNFNLLLEDLFDVSPWKRAADASIPPNTQYVLARFLEFLEFGIFAKR